MYCCDSIIPFIYAEVALQLLCELENLRLRLNPFWLELQTTEVSHLALVVIAVALKNKRVYHTHFPEMAESPGITTVLRRA